MTLVVLAHPNDAAAARLVHRWRPHGARLMLPRDLSRAGWRMYVGGRGEEWFVADGERCQTSTLRGVLTRLPVVEPAMLPHLHAGDRDYVATEMTAFLIAWLAKLRCTVLNRPTAASMLGPNVGNDRLPSLAARQGIRLVKRSPGSHESAPLPNPCASVTVVGERWFGSIPAALGAQAVRLAAAVGASLMTAQYVADDSRPSDQPDEMITGPGDAQGRDGGVAALLGAELLVDTDKPEIADAVLELLQRQSEPA